ncbi:hypothetical protein [Streptomyces ochraceiscleroticus]|uniref:hypothetical protein n=1 Tax=Streptomyces ochraceiscleroticus TaxID=47761 RepID=UPI0004C4F2DA|nr:hypothetical protein [Streptomyces ochraceiscleroticus]
MGSSAWDAVTNEVFWLGDGVAGLPAGLAGERYLCRSCGQALILKGTKPDAKVLPYFSHPGDKGCAHPELEAQIDADTEVVIRFRDMIRAIPGFSATVESLGENPKDPSGLPPVIIACHGETTVAIERPGSSLPALMCCGAVSRRFASIMAERSMCGSCAGTRISSASSVS